MTLGETDALSQRTQIHATNQRDIKMNVTRAAIPHLIRTLLLGLLLMATGPAIAQKARTITLDTPLTGQEARETAQFRAQFDTMMANFERVATKQGNLKMLEQASEARLAMNRVSQQQLTIVYARIGYPNLAAAVLASELIASSPVKEQAKSAGLPAAAAVVSQCNSVDYSASRRYSELIAKEVTSGLLAAATFVCTQDVLGENGSAACIPLAIADDVAQSLFNVATFCSGEESSNQIDASYQRLAHLHDDLTAGITSIVNNDNSNKTAIIANDNANKTTIVANDNTNTANIIANDNTNKTTIVTNANTNTTNIINNDNANKTTLITVANANTATIVAEIRALGCEIVRLLNTPDGQRASSILACSAAPGFPYSWNNKR